MTTVSPFYRLFLTGTISAIMLISCSSRTPKADDAFELVKKERMQSNDSSFVSNKIIQESMKTVIEKKAETPDEWTLFKTETEKNIRVNEKIIKELEALENGNGSLRRKVANLKKENSDLRIRMDEYKEEVKVKWENVQNFYESQCKGN